MHVLLATTFLNCLSGSELFFYDLARGLRRRGYRITVWLREPVLTAPLPRLLRHADVETTGELPSEGEVDAVVFQLKETFPVFDGRYLRVPRFAVCHGPKLPAEVAPPDFPATTHLALTREGYDHLLAKGYKRVAFTGYGVDLERFRPTRPLPEHPKTAVVHSKYADLDMVRAACDRAGIDVLALGADSWSGPFNRDHYSTIVAVQDDGTAIDHSPETAAFNVDRVLARGDIVFGLGRSIVEGMAMAKSCVVFGYGNVGDGLITSEKLTRFAAVNFSGRARGHRYDVESLARELAGYWPGQGAVNRTFCETHYGLEPFLDRVESLLLSRRPRWPDAMASALAAPRLRRVARRLA